MKSFLLRAGLCLMIALGAVANVAPHPAAASGIDPKNLPAECRGAWPTAANRWIAVWNFDSSTGCMLFTGDAAPGQTPPISGFQFINCDTVGTVSYENSFAVFNGSGYLACSFAPQPGAGANAFALYHDFWVYAYAKVDLAVGGQPIFYHPNASLGVRRVTAGSGYLEWRLQHPGQAPSLGSAPFNATAPLNELKVVAACTDAINHCATTATAAYAHTAYINEIKQLTQTAPAPVWFKTAPTTVYIGYSPQSQEMLRGRLGKLLIDPTQVGRDPTGD